MSGGTSSTVTAALLMTDVEGSTVLWHDHPDAMDAAMQQLNVLIAETVAANNGWLPLEQGEGDSRMAVFDAPSAAARTALGIQLALQRTDGVLPSPLRVRIGVHMGEVIRRDGGVHGDTVNRAARLRDIGHGGQVLLSEAAYVLLRDALPPQCSLRDLGSHRMKDLTRPERVFQLVHPQLPSEFGPLRSLERARHNLPIQLSSFIGREEQLATLRELVRAHQLVTITGFGGMGKTRTALQVAAELADGTGDGVWFVDLAPLRNPELVADTVAGVLGVRQAGGQPTADALISYLADKSLLLVLDNLEQLLPDAATLVAALAAAGPDVHVLATSREALHVRGEHEYALVPMPTPEPSPAASVESLEMYDSVTLFIARATEARSDFAVTNDTAPAIAGICARLDGLPLAIELAAARIRSLPPKTLLARLTDRLGVLTGGQRDLPSRHQTLRGAIAWSYELLAVWEQQLLDRLSVFAGSASLDAVEAVCEPDLGTQLVDLLSSIVEKSLVRQVEDGDGGARYVLLETVRAFAAERLASEPEQSAHVAARHASYYRDAVEALVAGHLVSAEAITFVARELDNVRAALAEFRRTGDIESELKLLSAAGDPLWHGGHWQELLDSCIDAISRAPGPSVEVFALHDYAAVVLMDRDLTSAASVLTKAEEVAAALDAPALQARALNYLGLVRTRSGHDREAAECFDRAAALAERELGVVRRLRLYDAERVLADVARHAAELALYRADWPGALAHCDRAVDLAREICDRELLAVSLRSRGTSHLCAGDLTRARRDFDEAADIARADRMHMLLSSVLHRRAKTALLADEVDSAEGDVAEAAALGADDPMTAVVGACVQADVLLLRGRWEEARGAAALACDLARDALPVSRVQASVVMARALRSSGDLAGARRQLCEALDACIAEPSLRSGVASCLRELAAAEVAAGRHDVAARLIVSAISEDAAHGHVALRRLARPADDAVAAAATDSRALTPEECRALVGDMT